MLLYIVRHGDPIYETDTLTPRGRLQAEAVGKRIAASGINRIYSSPMGRARETAAPACRILGLECNIENWAHEIGEELFTDFPDGVRKSITMVQNTYYRENGNIDRSYDDAFSCQGIDRSGMRSAVEFIGTQGDRFLSRLGYVREKENYRITSPNADKIALFCHAAMARAWMSYLFHIPLNVLWASFDYTHTGVTVIEFANNENGLTAPKCLCFSDTSHLYAHGPDTVHNGRVSL